jgi:hypothetical protein
VKRFVAMQRSIDRVVDKDTSHDRYSIAILFDPNLKATA